MENKNSNKNNKLKSVLVVVSVISFVMFLIMPTAVWTVLSVANLADSSIMEKIDFDTGENRKKAELNFDDGVNGIFSNIEKWYDDRVPFRSVIFTAQKNFWNKIEEPYVKIIRPALMSLIYSSGEDEEYDSSYIDSDIQEIPGSSKHNYRLISAVEPTCKEEGVSIYRCKKCSHEERVVSAPAHKGEVIKVFEPSISDYGYKMNRCTVCGSEYRSNITNRLPDSTYLPLINHGLAFEGKHNWIFYNGNNTLGYYQGTNLLTDEQLREYNDVLNRLHDVCEEKGIKLSYMIMPNKEEVYSEYMPDIQVQAEEKRVERLVSYVKESSGIDIVYPLSELREAKPYWQVYRKHDTHWNNAGAYIGTQQLYKSLGIPCTELMTLKVTQNEISGGDLINIGSLSKEIYSKDINYTIEYKPQIKLTYESGEKKGSGTRISQSTSPNECNFVMISDSFRNSMIPFLEKDFSNCTITHRDNIGDSVIKEAIRNADVIVVASVERQHSSMLTVARRILEIIEK